LRYKFESIFTEWKVWFLGQKSKHIIQVLWCNLWGFLLPYDEIGVGWDCEVNGHLKFGFIVFFFFFGGKWMAQMDLKKIKGYFGKKS
jgi:hypothetical protein